MQNFFSFEKFKFYEKNPFFFFNLFFLLFSIFEIATIKVIYTKKRKFSESLRSWAQKNEGKDRFFVVYKTSKKNELKQFVIHVFVSKTFYKNYNISKVKKYCILYSQAFI